MNIEKTDAFQSPASVFLCLLIRVHSCCESGVYSDLFMCSYETALLKQHCHRAAHISPARNLSASDTGR